MKSYDVYIFDLDGTLLDTLDDLAASCNHALHAMGMPVHSTDDVRRFVGNGVRKLIERAVPDGEHNPAFEQTLDIFRRHYMEHSLDSTRPYPGIMALLQNLKSQGKMVAVVSNKFDAATKSLCTHFFGQLVDVAIGESEKVRKKPAPDTVLEAIRLLGAENKEVVYVGDSDVDIATAANSGIHCVSVLWGFRDRHFLTTHGATEFVETPEEIIRIEK